MKYLHRSTRPLLIILFSLPFYLAGCNSGGTDEVTDNATTNADGATSVDTTGADEATSVDTTSTVETTSANTTSADETTPADSTSTGETTPANTTSTDGSTSDDTTSTDGSTSDDATVTDDVPGALHEDDVSEEEVDGLDATEASHLTFMREEEKLARDVYLTLADLYPKQQVFSQIATRAEQTHTDTMRDKLDQYNLPDPNPDTNNLPSSLGVFTGDEWGWYFMEKFALLTAKGEVSELDALYVGALIEELDMHDIAVCPQVMIDRGFSSPCGLAYTDEDALQTAYSTLISGSESHLRAYVGQIEAVIGVGNYEAQYLTQEEVDAILGR